MHIPDFITHYSRGKPFQSISSAPRTQWPLIIQNLSDENSWGQSRFQDPDYLEQRLLVEEKIRHTFIKKGGKPILLNPIYFFLGRNKRFEEHPANKAYTIALKEIDPATVSFTYGDSMLGHHEQNRIKMGPSYQNPLCLKIFTLAELPDLFLNPDFPKEDALAVEAHLWISP